MDVRKHNVSLPADLIWLVDSGVHLAKAQNEFVFLASQDSRSLRAPFKENTPKDE